MSTESRVKSTVDMVTSILTLVAAFVVIWSIFWPRVGQSQRPPNSPSPISEVSGQISHGSTSKGHENAKLAIIEFSDFECPFCGRYAKDVYPKIQTDLVDGGIVSYSFRHFPLETIHKAALGAGEASVCAGQQGKFWEMHDRLFQNQNSLDPGHLVAYGQELGLDDSRFKSCLDKRALEPIREDQEEARKFGITATPTFLIGVVQTDGTIKVVRKISGAQPYDTFKTVIDSVLKGA